MKKYLLLILISHLFSCKEGQDKNQIKKSELPSCFKTYWYSGSAEITSYKLDQARYGELRNGTAVTVFVTEDFSKLHQVKLDEPQNLSSDAIPILKFNLTKNFTTGIYPYSMMLSVFKPFDIDNVSHPLKITSTSQEWCGHTFCQLNSKENNYSIKLFSYFEKESDQEISLPKVWLEDELWSQIRMNPKLLPVGEFQIISGFLQQRLLHYEIKTFNAVADQHDILESISWLNTSEKITAYHLKTKDLNRELTIYYSKSFPYRIFGWEEKYEDGLKENKKMLTTRASLMKSLNIDYWNHNKAQDSTTRKALNLFN
ncbi:MAG: hypothetical protein HY062_13575 [Bacteroidetes bacterium]|nr:hypothetical protein [Bacteroidota bacterium]